MNKIEKMKLVGVTLASPSFRKNSVKTGSSKSPSISFATKSGAKNGNS